MGVGDFQRRLNGNSGRIAEETKALEMGRKFTEGNSEEGPAGGGYSRSKILDTENMWQVQELQILSHAGTQGDFP